MWRASIAVRCTVQFAGRGDPLAHPDAMVDYANAHLLRTGLLAPGDTFVVVFGSPVGLDSRPNSIQVHTAG